MSTKFPLTLLLMELSEEMRAVDFKLDLEWVKRDENEDADALSNGDCSKFDEALRVGERADEIRWRILEKVQTRGEEMYREVQALKDRHKEAKLAGGLQKRPRGTKKALPKW
eukprot:s708_g24.t1